MGRIIFFSRKKKKKERKKKRKGLWRYRRSSPGPPKKNEKAERNKRNKGGEEEAVRKKMNNAVIQPLVRCGASLGLEKTPRFLPLPSFHTECHQQHTHTHTHTHTTNQLGGGNVRSLSLSVFRFFLTFFLSSYKSQATSSRGEAEGVRSEEGELPSPSCKKQSGIRVRRVKSAGSCCSRIH